MTRFPLAVGLLTAVLVFVARSGDVARADPDTVSAGHDLLETAGQTYIDFSVDPIPADFFGPGSDPFDGQVSLQGDPFDSFGGFNGLTPTDTIVERLQDAGPTFPDTIDVEIVRLELVSVTPLTVTYNGGQNPENWDLTVEVLEGDTEQGTGSMTIRHGGADGGTFDIQLPVRPLLTFTRLVPPGSTSVRYPFSSTYIQFEAGNQPWCHTANPLSVPPGQIVIEKPGLTTNFFPGIDCGPPRTKATVVLDATDNVARHSVMAAEKAAPPAVGGIAELPAVSDSSEPPYAALAGGLAAAVAALMAGAWYARRRFSR